MSFYQLPESRRTASNLLFPFGSNDTAASLHKDGVRYYRSHNYRKAIATFKRALEQYEGNVKGMFLLGSSLVRINRFEEGLSVLRNAQQLDPTFSRIYAKRAYVLLGLGHYDRAVSDAGRYVGRTDVKDSNRIYGYLIKLAAKQLSGHADSETINRLVTEVDGLDLPASSLSISLMKLLTGETSIERLLGSNLTRGQETEVKTWGAVRAVVDGRTERARELVQWVLKHGDEQRYEYDLALALSHASLSNPGS